MAKAWSWSALESFETCAKRYWHLNVAKDYKEDQQGEALVYGKMVHKAFEHRVLKGTALPLDLRHLEKLVAPFAEVGGTKLGEQKLAINEDFELTGWFDSDVWCRSVLDLTIIDGEYAVMVDWKTGKQKDDVGQLELGSAILFAALPEVDTIHAAYVWTKTKKKTPLTLTREMLPAIWNNLMPRVKRYQVAHATTEFPARPSGLCKRYCPVTGCPHNGE